jgi:hypothetical protein
MKKIKKVKKVLDIAFDNLYRTINYPYGGQEIKCNQYLQKSFAARLLQKSNC